MKPFYDQNNITIYCGDCLEVMPELESQSIGLVVTSPPYNVGIEYELNQSDVDFTKLLREFARTVSRVMDGGSFAFVNIADKLCTDSGVLPALPRFHNDFVASGCNLYDVRIWHKSPSWTQQWHSSSVKSVQEFEYMYIYQKQGHSQLVLTITNAIKQAMIKNGLCKKDINDHFGFSDMARHWTDYDSQPSIPSSQHWQKLKDFLGMDNSLDNLHTAMSEPIRSRLEESEWTDWGSRGVWRFNSERNRLHPAIFPLIMPTRAIRLLSRPIDIILDPFMGSGTTLWQHKTRVGALWVSSYQKNIVK